MPYQESSEKKYFPAIVAALIVLSAAIGYFVYSLVTGFDTSITPEVVIEETDGIVRVNPGDSNIPTSPPYVTPPVTSPPQQ